MSFLSPRAKAALEVKFLSFRPFIPSDFCRKPRTLKELNLFKANEFRLILLYLVPVWLDDIVSPELYKRLLLLHTAIRLLDSVNDARELINGFVEIYPDTFGNDNFTFNTHCLLHIPDL